jgi:aminomethyltransferase
MLRGTAFHTRTSALCQAGNWRRWAGYVVAGSYELTHEREYYAIRSAAALIDISPLFKYLVRGPDAMRLLDRVVTRDVANSKVGQVMYTPWCDEAGKVLDDGTLARLSEQAFRLTAAEPNLRWLNANAAGLDVVIEDVSEATAALALQGPASREVLSHVTDADIDGLRFFHVMSGNIHGIGVSISRTGYTGDLGYEIWVAAQNAERLWDVLVSHGAPYGVTPAGMLALDVARIEAGLLLIDVDYVPARKALIESQKSSPFELGLGWTVRLEKDYFVGRRALHEQQRRGLAWQLRGLEVGWDSLERLYGDVGLTPQLPGAAWRTSVPVYGNGTQVGYATSGCWSPILKKYIALAHLQTPYAVPGTALDMEVTVEHRRRRAGVRVVKTPFFDPDRKRS